MPAFFFKKFEIRWSDVDANRHLGNTWYISYMSHVRMSFFTEIGFGQLEMAKNKIGPVITYERVHYFKEIMPDQSIWVSLSLKGISDDATIFKFMHRFYNQEGRNLAACEMMGTWIDLESRKIKKPPQHLFHLINKLDHEEPFEELTIGDLKSNGLRPSHLKHHIEL